MNNTTTHSISSIDDGSEPEVRALHDVEPGTSGNLKTCHACNKEHLLIEFARWLSRDEHMTSFSSRHTPNLPLQLAHEFLQERG